MKFKLKPDEGVRVRKITFDDTPHKLSSLILDSSTGQHSDVGLLWIHGGGYFLGMSGMVYMSRAHELVTKYSVTVFSPGYRLALKHPYPAAIDDCFTVLKYMDENREELGIKRIMIGGESAGGGLCAALCMMARDRGIEVAFQFPLYPMLSCIDTESSRNNHGRVWNTWKNHLGWRLYLRGMYPGKKGKTDTELSPYASPAMQTDYKNLPPCYTFVGDGEPFYQETLDYVERLRTAGVDAEVDVYKSDMHAFDMLEPDSELGREAIQKFNQKFEQAMVCSE